jgi:tetratricopeptide (TPR) repeat protein
VVLKAEGRSAYREAIAALEQALEALQHLPDTRETREQAIDLRLALRAALLPARDLERILVVLREAEALAEALDDARRLGQISAFLSHYFYHRGACDLALAAGQRALALATASEDVRVQASANQHLGLTYEQQGEYRRAIDCFKQTVVALDGTWRRERFAVTYPEVFSRAHLAMCHAQLGTFAEGRALGEEGLRIAEAVDHPLTLIFALWGVGRLFLRQGDVPRALPRLERAMGLCREMNLLNYSCMVAPALGAAYTLGGRVADAVLLLTQALEQSVAAKRVRDEALCSLSLGEAQVLAGRLAEAQALTEHTLELARTHKERGNEAYALRLLGDIAARRESPESEQAEAHYWQALALADELGMCPLQAHCRLGLGTLYARLGRLEQARIELSAAIALYRAMEMTFWLPQAEAALVQVEAQ